MSATVATALHSTYRTVTTSMSCAIFAALALATSSIALIVAAVNPAINGRAIAAVAGLLILAMAAAVTTMSVAYRKFDAATSNDHWFCM